MTVRPLPTVFDFKGWHFEQVWRRGSGAIYRKSKGRVVVTEAILVKVQPGFRIGGKDIPEREVYPKDEDWGTLGWTCDTMDRAMSRLEEVCK